MRFEIRDDGTGLATSVDQPLRRKVPLALRTRIAGSRLAFEVPEMSASFRGRLVEPDRIDGVFDFPDEGGERPMVLRAGEPSALRIVTPPLTSDSLEAHRRELGLAGLAVAVSSRGGATRVWQCGERKRRSAVAVAEGDVWALGSCTKSLTATMIARLVDRGVLRWDDTIGDVLGQAAPDRLAIYAPVTLRHLLSHRAGLIRDLPSDLRGRFGFDPGQAPADRLAAARHVLSCEPIAPIGAPGPTYSNLGFPIAAAMAEVRTDRSYEELMRSEVFEPLGLETAVFRQSENATFRDGGLTQPVGHPDTGYGLGQSLGFNPPPYGAFMHPSGGAAMSLRDFLTYLAVHRDEPGYLERDTWRTLHTDPFGEEYALGWRLEDVDGGGLIHGGALPGWLTKASVNKSRGTVMAAVMNDRHGRGEALLTQCISEGLSALEEQ